MSVPATCTVLSIFPSGPGVPNHCTYSTGGKTKAQKSQTSCQVPQLRGHVSMPRSPCSSSRPSEMGREDSGLGSTGHDHNGTALLRLSRLRTGPRTPVSTCPSRGIPSRWPPGLQPCPQEVTVLLTIDTGKIHTSQDAGLLRSQCRTHPCSPGSREREKWGQIPYGCSEGLSLPTGTQHSAPI